MADNLSITSSSDSDNDSNTDKVRSQKQLMSSGSTALLSGSARDAAEKFKSALDMLCDEPSRVTKKISPVELIIRYALCIAWIKCKEYRDIVRAIESLNQLIDCGHANKLPAIYLALAKAYFTLNRFKAALEPIEKALKNISVSNIKQYCWPEIKQPIEETSKDFLKKSLLAMKKDCGAYRPPDATCRYEHCLNVHKSHILPSENIYFTDPDFLPFLFLSCEAKCKVAYHDSCWKQLKHDSQDLEKPKDFLGQTCPTENCATTDNGNMSNSIITEVKLIGREGFDKPQKCWLHSDNVRKHTGTSGKKQHKSDTNVDKSLHTKDKPSTTESNGHIDKINEEKNYFIINEETEDEGGSKEHPAVSKREPIPPSVVMKQSRIQKCVASHCSFAPQALFSVHNQPQFGHCASPKPSYVQSNALLPCHTDFSYIAAEFRGAPIFHNSPAYYSSMPAPNNQVPFHAVPHHYSQYTFAPPLGIQFESPPVCSKMLPNATALLPPRHQFYGPSQTQHVLSSTPHPHENQVIHQNNSSTSPCVEVVVPRTTMLSAGSTLLVPVGPSGGPVKVVSSPSSDSINVNHSASGNVATLRVPPHDDLSSLSHSHVEVVVPRATVLSAGTTLLVPLGPSGGPVKAFSSSSSCSISAEHIAPQNTQSVSPKTSYVNPPLSTSSIASMSSESHSVCTSTPTLVSVTCGNHPESTSTSTIASEDSQFSHGDHPSNCVTELKNLMDKSKKERTHCISKQSEESNPGEDLPETQKPDSCKDNSSSFAAESLSRGKSANSDETVLYSSIGNSTLKPAREKSYPEQTLGSSNIDRSNTLCSHSSCQCSLVSLLSKTSTLQAKIKHQRPKEKKPNSEIQPSLCSPGKRPLSKSDQEPSAEKKLSSRVQQLRKARKINFGYTCDNYVNPELPYFGQINHRDSNFVNSDVDGDTAEFVFSYYQSIFENNGPSKIEDLESRWTEDYKQLQLPESFYDSNKSISKFLLQSSRFAAIDNIIGTSELLPNMFSKAEVELTESISFLLFSKVQKPRGKDDRTSPDPTLHSSKSEQVQLKNPFSDRTRFSSTSSCPSSPDMDEADNDTSVAEELDTKPHLDSILLQVDNNKNPIDSFNRDAILTDSIQSVPSDVKCLVKSRLCPTSEPFVPGFNNILTKGDVYMSDDDEVLEGSFVDGESETKNNLNGGDNYTEEYKDLPPGAVVLDEPPIVPPTRWSDGDDCSRMNATNIKNSFISHVEESEAENYLSSNDLERENLITENNFLKTSISNLEDELKTALHDKETLIKALSEASSENSELSSEVIALTMRVELQAEQVKTLEKTIGIVKRKIDLKEEENRELERKIEQAESAVSEMKKNFETQTTKQLEKIHKDHAKEINYLSKKLMDEKQTIEKKVSDAEKDVKQQSLKLWKELFDFKFKTLQQTCTSKIIFLNLLKDKMSDTVSPTKSEISSSVKKLENILKGAVNKEKEMEEMYKKHQELLEKGLLSQLPQEISLPDANSVLCPIESAINSLEQPSPSDASRNLFSSPQQQFNNSLSANGTPIPSQSHDGIKDEGFQFKPYINDTYQLWQHSFPTQGLPSFMRLSGQQTFPSSSVFSSMMSSTPATTNFQNILSPMTASSASFNPIPPVPSNLVNGSAASSSFQSIIGSKIQSGAPQKPNSNLTQPSMTSKPTTMLVQVPAPSGSVPASLPAAAAATSLANTGAIAKLHSRPALSSPASLTPIVPVKTAVRKGRSNYDKLMGSLQKMFPTHTEAELSQALKMAREKNNNSLTSLSHSEIVAKVEEIVVKQFKKPNKLTTSMGLEKFAQNAWGAANRTTTVDWDGGEQELCVICHDPMSNGVIETLLCKHAFHKECLRKWFERDRVCPNCRTPSNMQDEFPPLG